MSINKQHIQDAANDFRIGYEKLASMFGQRVFPLRSTVVLAALSVEIQLKFLIAKSGGEPPRIHKLNELFQKLDKELQDQLRIRWKQHKSGPPVVSLDEALVHLDSVFVDWRYIYEKQTQEIMLNFSSLRRLVDCLQLP